MKRSMREKLGDSLKAEDEKVSERFQRADTELARKRAAKPQEPQSAGKVIRDSFTMPLSDRELISTIKKRCMRAGIDTNKSEILRAGLAALDNMNDKDITALFEGLTKVKTGRPLQAA
jgi:hypothetical protein